MADGVVLVLVRDLIFSSRISATARAQQSRFKLVADPSAIAAEPASRLIVDLNQPGALEAAADWKQRHGGDVIGFVSHVDAETIARARAAGIERILARSQFVTALPELLRV
jgi:hypothetical protein